MTVNPALVPVLEAFAAFADTDWSQMPVDVARAMMDAPLANGEPLAMAKVEDLILDLPGRTIGARFYAPEGSGDTPPVVMYFHGGGWVLGNLDTHDGTCRELARASGSAVLSVDYRLAPEARYPAAAEDCYDACIWAEAHAQHLGIDATRMAVAGDSAGGNLAAAVAVMARDRGGPALQHQLLIYPVTDTNFETRSYANNGGGEYFLSTSAMKWFWSHYLSDLAQATHPYASPLRAPDLRGLPPTWILTAEYDVLCDEGQAFADRLQQAGVAVESQCAWGLNHGFLKHAARLPQAGDGMAHACAWLRKRYAEIGSTDRTRATPHSRLSA